MIRRWEWRSYLGLFALGVGLVAWWSLDRRVPVEILAHEVTTPVVRPGEPARVLFTVQRHRVCPVHIDSLVFDAGRVRRILPPEEINAPAPVTGEPERYAFERIVPYNALPGPAVLRFSFTYTCNPIQAAIMPVVDFSPPVRFEVTGR